MKSAVIAADDEQEEPEHGRRDPPGARLLPFLEQLAEDGHERGRERGVRDERAHEVRDLEGDGEGVDRAARAEVVRGHDLAEQPEHAREPGRGREDRGRPREPPVPWLARPRSEYRNGVSRDGRAETSSARILRARRVRAFLRDAEHSATEKARPDRRAPARGEPPLPLHGQDPDEAARGCGHRGDKDKLAAEHLTNRSKTTPRHLHKLAAAPRARAARSTRAPPAGRCTRTRPRARRPAQPASSPATLVT